VADPARAAVAVVVRVPPGEHPGWLLAWRRGDGGWRALVRYTRVADRLTFEHWVSAGAVTQR